MSIVILALNSKYIHSSLAPWYLKAEVLQAEVLEHTINEDFESIVDNIVKRKPKILAISVYIWNVTLTEKLVKTVKTLLPEIIIVLGGPEVSYNPREVLEKSDTIDYVISGEGEIPFRELCNHILYGKDSDLSGVSGKNSIATPFIGKGTPKSPYSEEYFSKLNGRISYFESSRGCPYSCAYCLSGRCEGVRYFDLEYVKENLIKLANSSTKTIKFVDRTFNSDKKRAFEIFSFIIENYGKLFPSDVCFHFELSGDLLDDKTINLLKTAPQGLFQFEIGIQSFCQKTIAAIHRKTDNETLKKRISELVSLGNAHVHTDLIAGLPYENYESFKQSFNVAYSLGANMLQLGFLKILHGTELEAKATEYKFKFPALPPYEVYETPWLSSDEMRMLKITENALDKLHNSGRFKRTLSFCIPCFENAYDFFFECGMAINNCISLNDLTDVLYAFLCDKLPDFKAEIRDMLVCDRYATNSSRGLPKSLYVKDDLLGKIKSKLESDLNRPLQRRNVAILYSMKKIVYVDYDCKNHFGEYKLNFLGINEI